MKYSAGFKYQLREDFSLLVDIHPEQDLITEWVLLNTEGRLTLRRGFASDGPSDPAPDLPSAMRASFLHDALYSMIRQGLLAPVYKDAADKLLREICLQDGMPHFMAQLFYTSVSRFGDPYIDPLAEKAVRVAP